MIDRIATNKVFLTDLFTGHATRHGIITLPQPIPKISREDVAISQRPIQDWIPWTIERYESSVKMLEEFQDDSVPYAHISTGTEIFAAAFGCPVHIFEESNPAALPVVSTSEEADELPMPDLSARTLERVFEFAGALRKRLGPDVPISVPDIQSPFDIAALIWRKEDFFIAMHDSPDAVKRLVDKCRGLLTSFLTEFKREFPNCSLCHCPVAWAPPELGCWMSEDEAGSLNTEMFEEFCLPPLVQMSQEFGGMFIHCCAAADHQYQSFGKVPNLRAMNRVFQDPPGPKPWIDAFSGSTVLMMAWYDADYYEQLLDMSLPSTRILFNIPSGDPDVQKAAYDRLRSRIG